MITPRFVILIPAFHAEQWIERCLKSALEQDYPHSRIIWVEDHSADGTGWRGRQAIEKYNINQVRVDHWTTSERQGILANQMAMLKQCEDEEIAVLVDGDDQLAHSHVLHHLAKVYQDPDVWVTWGSFEFDYESRNPNGDARGICRPVPPHLYTRKAGWVFSHLKTFRVKLARHIKEEDLKFRGEWIDAAPDLALMFPIIEMAGPKHARYIESCLYYYNDKNLLSESRIKPAWVRIMVAEIMSRPIYPLLERL